jgi:hypothetical protein
MIRKKRVMLGVIGVVFLMGWVRSGFEATLHQRAREAGFHLADVRLDLRERLGQAGFIGALSGFRALVADVIWLEAWTAWSRMEWVRLKVQLEAVTRLQPRCVMFWTSSAWHMTHNAAGAMLLDERMSEGARKRAEREYQRFGEAFLRRGLGYNSESPELWTALADLYANKYREPEQAAALYLEASRRPGAFRFVERFAYFQLAKVRGREREAYENLRRLYLADDDNRKPTLLRELGRLERELNIPEPDRLVSRGGA